MGRSKHFVHSHGSVGFDDNPDLHHSFDLLLFHIGRILYARKHPFPILFEPFILKRRGFFQTCDLAIRNDQSLGRRCRSRRTRGIGRIAGVEPLTGKIHAELNHVAIFPASHYVVSQEKIKAACDNIEEEMKERVQFFKGEDKLIEAQRIAERTNFDIEMLRETGFCSGIENYSRHLNGLPAGAPPMTLLDFFPDDFLIIVDESHMTIPQIRGMYAGDRSRKQTLVDYGFRLPSALDNRPLNFEEFEAHIDQMMFVSATPSDYEKEHELLRTEQIIRPTGLLDPEVQVRPVEGQIDDLIGEVNKEIAQHHKVLITTLTKRMAEDLTD